MRKKNPSSKTPKKQPLPLTKIPSSFDCSGSCQLSHPFTLSLLPKDAPQMLLKLPHPSPDAIQQAIKNGKKSGFGKGTENVVDESYRLAYEFLAEEIGLPSGLSELVYGSIGKAVRDSLGLDCGVRAELIKLNIYPKGGKFKKHVDSPKAEAFGSLVVFLPCFFTGGELLIENKEDKHNFSFGGNKTNNTIDWVAFYNDCLHQITQVTQGYRLTLSYNLFHEGPPQGTIFPKPQLLKILSQLKNSQTYGYFCQHYYGNNALKDVEVKLKEMRLLKGKDYDLYVAAKAIGCERVEVRVLYEEVLMCLPSKLEQYQDQQQQLQGSKGKSKKKKSLAQMQQQYQAQQQQHDLWHNSQKQTLLLGNPEHIQKPIIGWQQGQNEYYEDQLQILTHNLKTKIWHESGTVVWLNERTEGSNYTYAFGTYYGNDYSVNEKYCQLVMLLYL